MTIHPVQLLIFLIWASAALVAFWAITFWIESIFDRIEQKQWAKDRKQRYGRLAERLEGLEKAEKYIATISDTVERSVYKRGDSNIEDLSPASVHKGKKKRPNRQRKNRNRLPRFWK